jgi:hypothetical protein
MLVWLETTNICWKMGVNSGVKSYLVLCRFVIPEGMPLILFRSDLYTTLGTLGSRTRSLLSSVSRAIQF